MRLLVSVRDAAEALAAAEAGADFIDLKDPSAGALGALPLETIRAVVALLRTRCAGRPVSATVGDFPGDVIEPVLERVALTAACGVDYVKVGIATGAHALLEALATCDAPVVPVLIADSGIDEALVQRACRLPFAALMLDTQDKLAGSLVARCSEASLRRFVTQARKHGHLSGLAGALRVGDVDLLRTIGPDFAGFRSAVCSGARTNALEATRVRSLREQVHAALNRAEASPTPLQVQPH
jgi:(5-formylfuran-3-yl)methyl phosphate synthase